MTVTILFFILFASLIFLFLIAIKVIQLKQHGLLTKQGVFKFVDRIIIFFSIIGIFVTLLWDFNYLRYKPPIEHKDWKSITLNDFRGLKRPLETLDGESKFAFVSTNVRVIKRKDKIEIKTYFYPCRSYVYNRKLYANGLLTHEIYHFHIAEYCARLIRKSVQDRIDNYESMNLSEIKNNILILENELQYQYDDETYHSYVLGKQIEWQDKIDSSLKSLENYSNTVLSLQKQTKE
jgi:hypothetical protein